MAAWHLILGIDDEAAAHAFTFAFSMKVGFVAESKMNDAALARRHGIEAVRRAGAANFLSGNAGSGAKFLNAQRAMILAIETNLLVLARRQTQHFQAEELEGAQELSATIKQEGRIGAGEVDKDFGFFPVAILGQRRIDDDPVLEAKSSVSDDGLEKLVDLFGGGGFVRYGHGWLSLPARLKSCPSRFSFDYSAA
jgi:hypothetical protein